MKRSSHRGEGEELWHPKWRQGDEWQHNSDQRIKVLGKALRPGSVYQIYI